MQKFLEILASIRTLPKEYIRTASALGRVIAEPVTSGIPLPEHDIASADGFAVRDLSSENIPATLRIVGESSSAKPFKGTLERGETVKMYAGGPVPIGTKAVTSRAVLSADAKHITINEPPVLGHNICPAGLDLDVGETVFKPGDLLDARKIGLASTAHLFWIPVVRKPRVAVLAVGSELAMPGASNPENPITASSLYSFSANISTTGGEPIILGTVEDSAEKIKEKFREAKGCDMLFTTGATSLAAGNLMQNVITSTCTNVHTLSVELNRNDCMIYGEYEGMPVCSVPGNPISAQIYSTLFVMPVIRKLVGLPTPKTQHGILGRDLDKHDISVSYLHSAYRLDENARFIVTPVSAQDGFLLSALSKADGLLVVKHGQSSKKGDLVEIVPF